MFSYSIMSTAGSVCLSYGVSRVSRVKERVGALLAIFRKIATNTERRPQDTECPPHDDGINAPLLTAATQILLLLKHLVQLYAVSN